MLTINRIILRSALVLIASTSLSHAELPVRAFAQYPDKGNPRDTITGRDGLLYGVIISVGDKQGGLVYRVVPGGTFEILHQFPVLSTAGEVNQGGSEPSHHFLMADDGCLYGLTQNGGLYGEGVLYRIRPDGVFSVVADLNPDTLPPENRYGGFVDASRCFLEGQDHAFYVTRMATGAVIRIERDGSMSVAGQTGYAYQVVRDPAQPFHMLAVSVQQAPGWPQTPAIWQVRIRRFDTVTGTVVDEITGPVFDYEFYSPYALQWTAEGLLVSASSRDASQGNRARLFRINLDGSMVSLTDFGYDGISPPYLEKFIQAKEDGTIYYTTGNVLEGYIGVEGGNTLIELKPDGQFRTVCGVGKYALFGVVEGADHSLFGTSWGDKIYVPRNGSGYSVNWMDDSNAANFEKINYAGNGGMFVQIAVTGSAVPTTPPVAGVDLLRTKGAAEMAIFPTANDYDPDGGAIQFLGAGPASQGGVVVESVTGGSPKLRFTPADTRKSAIIPYQITDTGNVPSTGTILVRGDYGGNFVNPGLVVGGKAFTIVVTQWGNFSATIPDSHGGTVKIAGEMDWYDRGLASYPVSRGNVVSLNVRLVSEAGEPLALEYRIRGADGTEVIGHATKVP